MGDVILRFTPHPLTHDARAPFSEVLSTKTSSWMDSEGEEAKEVGRNEGESSLRFCSSDNESDTRKTL